MKIPSPHEIGLSEKFNQWRTDQEDAISVINTAQKRITVIQMPTGKGKSPVGIAAALMSGKRTCYVTDSRGLQDQLIRDFGSCGLVDIRGRRNYQCQMREDYTCEDGYHARCPYKGSVGCPDSLAGIRAARSMLVSTNYDKWTSARKYGLGMEGFEQVIFDEGHAMPDALSRAMQVTLNSREVEDEMRVPFITRPEADEFANWKPWAAAARLIAEEEYGKWMDKVTSVSDPKASWVRKVTHYRNMMRRLGILANASAKDWVVDEIEGGYQFDPIRPGRYAEVALFLRVPKIIVYSATIRPKTLFLCNQSMDSFTFREYVSDFDPKRAPIYWVPTMRVDKNAHDLSMLWLRHDQIAARRRDRKGMVHTISFTRQEEITRCSRFSDNMLINVRGEAPTALIEAYLESGPGTELVSPSVGTGYDFPMKACEWQYICKIPFQDGRSKIVKARQAEDVEYGPHIAAQKLEQMVGRIVRSKEDAGETFIPDDHLDWFLPRWSHMFSKSFNRFFKKVGVIPPPPSPL